MSIVECTLLFLLLSVWFNIKRSFDLESKITNLEQSIAFHRFAEIKEMASKEGFVPKPSKAQPKNSWDWKRKISETQKERWRKKKELACLATSSTNTEVIRVGEQTPPTL